MRASQVKTSGDGRERRHPPDSRELVIRRAQVIRGFLEPRLGLSGTGGIMRYPHRGYRGVAAIAAIAAIAVSRQMPLVTRNQKD